MNIIYKITNQVNHKIYIGKTSRDIVERFKEHKIEANRYKNQRKTFEYESRLYPAMLKYGFENFSIEIIEKLKESDDINEKEKYYIKILNSTDSNIGYNISQGGLGGALFKGHKHSIKSKKQISKIQKDKKWYNNGSTETMVLKNNKPPEGFIPGRLKGNGFKTGESNPSYHRRGIKIGPMPVEIKLKLSQTKKINNAKRKKVWYTNGEKEIQIDLNSSYIIPEGYSKGRLDKNSGGNRKKIIIIDTKNQNIEKIFESGKEACKWLGCSHPTIIRACKNKKLIYNRYLCKYYEGDK